MRACQEDGPAWPLAMERCLRPDEERLSAALPFFQGLADSSVEELVAGAALQRFPPHLDIIRQGEHAQNLHLIVEGRVEEFSRYRERETTLNILGPGECFILAAVFLDRGYLKSARSLTPVRLLLMPAVTVRSVFASDPVFAGRLAADLAKGYRALVREVSNLKLRSSMERLANWLLHEAGGAEQSARFTIPFDKKTIAARLGIAPEVLSRNFAALAPYGVVVTGRTVELRDMPLFESYAQPIATIDDPSF